MKLEAGVSVPLGWTVNDPTEAAPLEIVCQHGNSRRGDRKGGYEKLTRKQLQDRFHH